MNRKILLIAINIFVLSKITVAQVGIGTPTPNASAQLDVTSTTKGMLVPRMTTAQRTSIITPATGLLVYDTDKNQFYYYNGTAWSAVPTSAAVSSGWLLGGNTGTNPATNFIGTTDAQPLLFKINNQVAGEINSNSNTSFGYQSNIFFGGAQNTGIGGYALTNVTGNANTALGYSSLYANISGNNNIAVGANALTSNSSGFSNVAIGHSALYNNTDRTNLVAIGDSALYNNGIGANFITHSRSNTAVGSKALFSNTTGQSNTANGFQALYKNTEGILNTAIGSSALYSNTTGTINVANGYSALYKNTTGNNNTAIGPNVLSDNTTGNNNTAIGSQALDKNTTGGNNTAVGYAAGSNLPTTVNNTTVLGNNAGFATTGSNQINVGNNSITFIGGLVNWSNWSDGRIKNNVQENIPGLAFIKQLRPVSYNLDIIKQDAIANEGLDRTRIDNDGKLMYKTPNRGNPDYPEQFDIEKIRQTGFIAQEVEAAAKKLGYDFSGVQAPKNGKGLYSLRYSDFVMPLVQAAKELATQNEKLQQQQNTQQQIIDQQKTELDAMKKKVEILETLIKK